MEDNIVYHYCSVDTFLNIIRNHTLRLSDLCKSTDRSELKSLLDAVQEEIMSQYRNNYDILDSVIFGMDINEAFSFMLERLISNMKNNTDQMLLGVCFSEQGDLLEQWREYADKGTGMAIGFDVGWFERLCENNMFKFSRVIYGYKEQNMDIVKEYATSIYDEMLIAMIEGNSKDIINNSYGATYMMELDRKCIYQESIFIKKDEYQNEREWRLIVNDEDTYKSYDAWCEYYNWKKNELEEDGGIMCKLIPNGMEFMVRNGKIIPYLDLKYDLDENNLPIKKIVIGPNCKVDELDIYHLLEFFGFDGNEIEIVRSASSYCL